MPKKDPKLIEKRREYIKQRVNKAAQPTREIKKLSKELFITERTVWRDLTAPNH